MLRPVLPRSRRPPSRPALPGRSEAGGSGCAFVLRSMNIGFLPSLSSCLNSIRGFSSRDKHRSSFPCTMYSAYWSGGALILYFFRAAGRTFQHGSSMLTLKDLNISTDAELPDCESLAGVGARREVGAGLMLSRGVYA